MSNINDTREIKLRRYENMLRITGAGAILFGTWSFVKTVYYLLFDFEYFEAVTEMTFDGITKKLFIGLILIYMVIDIILRIYVGRRAIRESKGLKRSYAYIGFAILFAVNSCISVGPYFEYHVDIFDLIACVVTELTTLAIFIELVVSAILVKRLRKSSAGSYISNNQV